MYLVSLVVTSPYPKIVEPLRGFIFHILKGFHDRSILATDKGVSKVTLAVNNPAL